MPPYRNLEQFEAAVHACDSPYTNQELDSLGVAWRVYQAARHPNLDMLVLGRIRNDGSTPENPGIDSSMRRNLEILNEEIGGGAIMQSDRWSLLVNDAFVLAGIHSQIEFHLASPRTLDNIINKVGPYPGQMTVTGRELTGLDVFGYRVERPVPKLEEVARCVDPDRAAKADFATYRKNITHYSESNKWVELVDRGR